MSVEGTLQVFILDDLDSGSSLRLLLPEERDRASNLNMGKACLTFIIVHSDFCLHEVGSFPILVKSSRVKACSRHSYLPSRYQSKTHLLTLKCEGVFRVNISLNDRCDPSLRQSHIQEILEQLIIPNILKVCQHRSLLTLAKSNILHLSRYTQIVVVREIETTVDQQILKTMF